MSTHKKQHHQILSRLECVHVANLLTYLSINGIKIDVHTSCSDDCFVPSISEYSYYFYTYLPFNEDSDNKSMIYIINILDNQAFYYNQ